MRAKNGDYWPIKPTHKDKIKSEAIEEILAKEEKPMGKTLEIAPDASVDSYIQQCYVTVQYLLARVKKDIQSGNYDRDTVLSLRDCLSMLFDLKKREEELLENMSAEDLEKLIQARKDAE